MQYKAITRTPVKVNSVIFKYNGINKNVLTLKLLKLRTN